jgi:hypothetical protein
MSRFRARSTLRGVPSPQEHVSTDSRRFQATRTYRIRFVAGPWVVMLPVIAGWTFTIWKGEIGSAVENWRGASSSMFRYWPLLLGLLFFTKVAEIRYPVEKRRQHSGATLQDFWWFLLEPLLSTLVTFAVLVSVNLVIDHTVRSYTMFPASSELPFAVRAIIVFIASDLVFYITHRARHRIPVLWRFHAVHHAQQSMNVFTSSRSHPIDAALTTVPIVVFFRLVGLPIDVGMAGSVFIAYNSLFVHANIRTSYGCLGWVIVSPQWHRVHHSSDPAHYDANFGAHFTIWDRMFGSAVKDRTLYPPTGWPAVRHRRTVPAIVPRWAAMLGSGLVDPFLRHPRPAGKVTTAGSSRSLRPATPDQGKHDRGTGQKRSDGSEDCTDLDLSLLQLNLLRKPREDRLELPRVSCSEVRTAGVLGD